jgi:hypothetical protein
LDRIEVIIRCVEDSIHHVPVRGGVPDEGFIVERDGKLLSGKEFCVVVHIHIPSVVVVVVIIIIVVVVLVE